MNALKLCKQVERADGLPGYQIAPSKLYPAAFKAMQDYDTTQPPPAYLAPYVAQAAMMPSRAYELVEVDPDTLSEHDRALRAGALELARLWFTAELRAAIPDDGQIVLMITKDPAWRL